MKNKTIKKCIWTVLLLTPLVLVSLASIGVHKHADRVSPLITEALEIYQAYESAWNQESKPVNREIANTAAKKLGSLAKEHQISLPSILAHSLYTMSQNEEQRTHLFKAMITTLPDAEMLWFLRATKSSWDPLQHQKDIDYANKNNLKTHPLLPLIGLTKEELGEVRKCYQQRIEQSHVSYYITLALDGFGVKMRSCNFS